jgi:Flp pilus assembly pilin Flp
MKNIKSFFQDETGLEASEYVVVSFLITAAVLVAFTSIGSSVREKVLTLVDLID